MKIDKSNQPLLKKLNIVDCPVSGKHLFDLNQNLGWENLKELQMGSDQFDQEQICEGFFNICQYNFTHLTKL